MVPKGWLLLVLFLLMQAGPLASATCRPGAMDSPGIGAACVLERCCCAEPGGSSPACACLEAPAGNEEPAPVSPVPTGGGRDLLPSVGWVEWRACARPLRRALERRADARADGWKVGGAAVPLSLTVRYCAFLI